MTTSIAAKTEHQSDRDILNAVLADLTEIRAEVAKLVTDLTATRLEVVDLVTDNANRIANHNTLIAKLNLDGGVTDADYAAATAAVATNPAALTATTPDALTTAA